MRERDTRTAVRRRAVGLMLVVTALLPACSTQTTTSGGLTTGSGDALMASMGPALAVERFLQAANAADYTAMGTLFGTRAGPVQWPRTELETQMDLISRILQHEDYRVGPATRVPGREAETTRIGVDLTIEGEVVPDVSFFVVLSDQGSWLVEEIDLEKVTNR